MTRSDLPQGQIVPAARPLDSFIQPARQNVAEPLRPQMMPEPTGLRIIPQTSGGNVQGVNQFAELARALQPFSDGAINLAGAGMKLYATNQVSIGERKAAEAALRAQALSNRQMLASQAEYAKETRKLGETDPIAALMMDRVNPFQRAGMMNRLARVAGTEIQRAVLNAYKTAPGMADLLEKRESPGLMQLHAEAVDGVLKKYGVDRDSPGFIEYVLPEIGQAQQKLFELHAQNHSNHLKETAWRQSGAEIVGVYRQALTSGAIEWQEFDPATGRPMRNVATINEKAKWERGLKVVFSQIAARLKDETGITGETAVMQRKMWEQVISMASADPAIRTELSRLVYGTATGPADKDGNVPTVASLFGVDLLEQGHKIAQIQWQQQQQQTEQGLQQFRSELVTATIGLEDGPARGAAIQKLIQKFGPQRDSTGKVVSQGLPLDKMYEAIQSMSKTLDEVAGRSYDSSGVDALLQDMQGRVGGNWNAAQADREFESNLPNVAPAERGAARRRYMEIRAAKEREKSDMPDGLINPLIEAWMKSNLRTAYPNTATEAALRGADISAMLAWGDADVAESSKRQLIAGRTHVYSRIRGAMTKKNGRLDSTETTQIISQALEEYGQKNKEALEYLFPGVGDEPSVGGSRPQPYRGGQRSSSGGSSSQPAATPPPVFSSGQLDNMPNRANRLKAGEVVMDLPSVQEEVTRMMNGRPPSAAAMRAARDAGFGGNVGRWLMQQADGYRDSFRIPEGARQQLLRSSRDAEGMANAIAAATRPVTGAVELAGRSLMDALMGVTPSYAAPRLAMREGGRNGGAPFTGRAVAMIGPINVSGLRRAIVGKESGGNFSAVNPDSGALGYGQVMPYNVGPWTQKHYGRRLTPQQFLSNREAQIAVVDGQIGEIVRQQLAAGYKGDIAIRRAAAIWYSGNGNLYDDNRPQFTKGRRYPSIREYTLDILDRYRAGSGLRSSAEPNEELGSQFIAQLEQQGGYEDVAGLQPLPMRRMFQQAGRPMAPERRARPNGPGYWELSKKDMKVSPALHQEVISRNQKIREAIDKWDPLEAENKQRLNNTNPNPRSRTVAPTNAQFQQALKPQLDAWQREARKAGAFASGKDDVTVAGKFDLSAFVDDKTRAALKRQVFLFLDEARGQNPDEASRWDLPQPFLLDLRKLGDDFLYEWNARRRRLRENTVDMIQMGRDVVRPIDLPGQNRRS